MDEANSPDRTRALQAGKAFAALAQSDPAIKAGMDRVRLRIQALAEAMRSPELAKHDTEWEQEYGIPYPKDVDDLKQLAVRAGVPSGRVLDGTGLTANNLLPLIQGYLQRLRDGKGLEDAPPAVARPKAGGRPKAGTEKWRQAQRKMLDRLQAGTLPTALRNAAELIGETYTPTRTAALKSPTLAAHFGLHEQASPAVATGDLLDTLSGTLGRQFRNLPKATRDAVENEWRHGTKQKALEWVKTLARDPDAGSTGDMPYIDAAHGQHDDSPG